MSRSFRYQEIADDIRSAIASGDLVVGNLLPSEADLSATHGASRVTIRRALEQLRHEGLVGSRQGFGWYVGKGAVRQSLDAFETIEDQLRSAGRESSRRVLSFGFRSPPLHASVALGDDALQVERLNLADGEPFALVTVWCAAGLGADLSRRDVESSTFAELLADRLGGATQVITAVPADARTAELLSVESGSPLLRVRRVTGDIRGGVALVSEHLYPADRTEFEVTLESAGAEPAGLRLVR